MNKYTEISDFEINLAVAHIVLGKDNYDWCPHSKMVKNTSLMIKVYAWITTHATTQLTQCQLLLRMVSAW
ncbi:hypothetical protein AB7378_15100 [Providencia rettgeri]